MTSNPLNYADPNVGRRIVIARFDDEAEARLAAEVIESNGIEAFVEDLMPGRGLGRRAARLAVAADDAPAAIALLKQTPAGKWLIA